MMGTKMHVSSRNQSLAATLGPITGHVARSHVNMDVGKQHDRLPRTAFSLEGLAGGGGAGPSLAKCERIVSASNPASRALMKKSFAKSTF